MATGTGDAQTWARRERSPPDTTPGAFQMTARRKILGRALVLAAMTTLAGAAVANASPSRAHHQKHVVGRVASLSATGLTINGKALTATRAQLAGLADGQCVEVTTRLRHGALNVVRIEGDDRCAALPTLTPAAPAATDDPPQADVGDDHGGDRAAPDGGNDDPVGHDAGDDHGGHGTDG